MRLLLAEHILLEAIKDKVQKKYDLTNAEMVKLGSMDPTPTKKYLDWIAKNYVEEYGDVIKSSEGGASRLSAANGYAAKYGQLIIDWDKFINKRKGNKEFIEQLAELIGNPNHAIVKAPSDINAYDGLYVLKRITELAQTFMSKGDIKKQTTKAKIGNYLIVVPQTEGASCYYGAGTKWCTAATKGANYFDRYAKDAIIFYVINLAKEEGEPLQKVAALKYFNTKDMHDIQRGEYTLWNVADKQLKGLEPDDIFPQSVVDWMNNYYRETLGKETPLTIEQKRKHLINGLKELTGGDLMSMTNTLGPGWELDMSNYDMDGTVQFVFYSPPEEYYFVYATPYYDGIDGVPIELQDGDGESLEYTRNDLPEVTDKDANPEIILTNAYMKGMKDRIDDFVDQYDIHQHEWLKVTADREFCPQCGHARELGPTPQENSDNVQGIMTRRDYLQLPDEYLFNIGIDHLGLTADQLRAMPDRKSRVELIMKAQEDGNKE